ncbi:hypothetical protein PPHE_b0849 [Pseudoalteromonas phenolica O-BC30]|nr:hypothetical protein [Pseudoalteromonas phenolica O-BC30]
MQNKLRIMRDFVFLFVIYANLKNNQTKNSCMGFNIECVL